VLVTTYFQAGLIEQLSYEMRIEEFRRISEDFQNYLKQGVPSDGTYEGFTVKGDPAIKTPLKIFLLFQTVSVIS
jgi:hypothetical protein